MLLQDSIEEYDLPEVKRLSELLPLEVIQKDVLPEVSIEARTWFWQEVTSARHFDFLMNSMRRAAVTILQDGDFVLGEDFSQAPSEDFSVLLVTPSANDYLESCLPPERYSTLQIMLRLVSEDREP